MRQHWSVILALGTVCALAGQAFSVPTFYILQEDARYTQIGATATALQGYQFLGRATPNDGIGPIDFNGGTISFATGSPLGPTALSPVGNELDYRSGTVTQATFQSDYPAGIYNFHLTDSANAAHTQDEAVDSRITPAPMTIPTLTAATFNGLQGMDPTKAFTISFNSFTDANPNALIFLGIVDSGNNTVLFDGLQPNVTQDTIAANTLSAGQQYATVLFFSNVNITPDNNGEVLMDNRTTTFFTTAPEPSGVAILALAAGGLIKRRQRKTPSL